MPHNPVVTPFGPVANPRGNIIPIRRPINPATIARLHGDEEQAEAIELRRVERELRQYDPHGQLGPRETVYDDELRDLAVFWWQHRIKWGCIILAYALIVYFGFQLGRGAL
jgi:hypothetical protein